MTNQKEKITVSALAKINLYLNVIGKRDDGYHLLDSLFAFADYGDVITLEKASKTSLKINGEFAENLKDCSNNIILKAVDLIKQHSSCFDEEISITLTKNLPVASGIGGGSADAAATIKGLCSLWGVKLEDHILKTISLDLGADVWACLQGYSSQVSGIGDEVKKYHKIPEIYGVLVNPKVSVSTPMIFKNYIPNFSKKNPMEDKQLSENDFIKELKIRSNDLEETAIKICPVIREVIDSLKNTKNCVLSRMSGSGATCFGLFYDKKDAVAAKQELLKEHDDWWIQEFVFKK